MFIYINGKIIKKEEAVISPFDHGFMYGLGLFETFRVYDGHPFLLDDHLARLHEGLQYLNVSYATTREELLRIVHRLLGANGWRDAYVRFNVSAGEGDIGLSTEPYVKPNVIMYMKPLPAFHDTRVCRTLTLRRNDPEGRIRLKSHHYLNNVLGKREIGNDTRTEGIFLTRDGFVAEGVVSNIFWVKNGVVYTPALQTGILDGVTRQFVIELLQLLHMPLEEGLYSLEEAKEADEVFLTNAIQEIVPVDRWDDCKYIGVHGEVTKRLRHIYTSFTRSLWTKNELKERMAAHVDTRHSL